jgi:glutaminyl-peptide cyclotransferase
MKIFPKGAAFAGSLLFLFLQAAVAQNFDGARAYQYLVDQCNLGSREPNAPGHRMAKRHFEDFLKKQKGVYSRDDFTYKDKSRHVTLKLTNFHLIFAGKTKKRYLLCAHWDTRPWADRDPNPLNRTRPIPGANDGASGVAILMELCNLFSAQPPSKTVEIILFDGEDYGKDNNSEWCLGSKHFAARAAAETYGYAVLLDMVGDKTLTLKREGNSQKYFPWLVERIWTAAKEIPSEPFRDEIGPAIYDDHLPLIEKGIPAIDLIDFEYPAWHTLSDTPDQCSPNSLASVGKVLAKLMYEE